MEVAIVEKTYAQEQRGQTYGLAIGIVAILAGAITASLGYELSGSLIGSGEVIGLVAVFVMGKYFDKK